MYYRLELEMPDMTHHSSELGGCFVGAAVYEARGNFPPGSRHFLGERVQLFVDFLGRREGTTGIALIAD
jgi:hypothetical protein